MPQKASQEKEVFEEMTLQSALEAPQNAKPQKKRPWLRRMVEPLMIAGTAIGLHSFATWFDPALYHHVYAPSRNGEIVMRIPNIAPGSTRFEEDSSTPITHEDLEAKIGCVIVGRYSDSYAEQLIYYKQWLQSENPDLMKNLRRIEVVPPHYPVEYSGANITSHSIILSNGASYGTFVHELAHMQSRKMPATFWKEWRSVSGEHYEFPTLGSLYQLSRKLFGDHYPDSNEFPKWGIMENYGRGNADEDLATFVEACHSNLAVKSGITRVKEEERELYERKLDILKKWGFITDSMHDRCMKSLCTESPEAYHKLLLAEIPHITAPRISKKTDYSGTFYTSSDGRINVIYGAGPMSKGGIIINAQINPDGPVKNYQLTCFDGKLYLKSHVSYGHAPAKPSEALNEFVKALNDNGYADLHTTSFPIIALERDGTREEVARKQGIPLEEVFGPIPYASNYGSSTQRVYCKKVSLRYDKQEDK